LRALCIGKLWRHKGKLLIEGRPLEVKWGLCVFGWLLLLGAPWLSSSLLLGEELLVGWSLRRAKG